MIILPGGQPGTDNLNNDPRIHRLLADFQAAGKLIGAICAAPIILAAAGLLSRQTGHLVSQLQQQTGWGASMKTARW